jgi:hypothetical protein
MTDYINQTNRSTPSNQFVTRDTVGNPAASYYNVFGIRFWYLKIGHGRLFDFYFHHYAVYNEALSEKEKSFEIGSIVNEGIKDLLWENLHKIAHSTLPNMFRSLSQVLHKTLFEEICCTESICSV